MNFLDLFNQVARVAHPSYSDLALFTSLDQQIKDSELDSLDTLIVCLYMAELYGIDDETSKEMLPETPQQLLEFINVHKTTEPLSLEAALSAIK